jgi:amino acid transporter
MPFLFVWTAMLFIPLIMSTGVIGILNYLGYFFPDLNPDSMGTKYWIIRSISAVVIVAAVVIALYRNIKDIGRLTTVLWVIMIATVGAVIAASFSHFDHRMAFDFPPDAFKLGRGFFIGLGGALIYAAYDYLGYNTTAYMAAELRDPGRTIPRSIIYSILGMMVIYLVMNIGMIGVVPWREAIDETKGANKYLASVVVERAWGGGAAKIVTALIVITAFGSLFTGLLGASRIPYNAALDKLFLPIFGKLHPRHLFPYAALLAMGVVTAIGSFFNLGDIIDVLTAIMVLIQCIGQIIALIVLRRRQPNLPRPYKMTLYPIPAIIALLGWGYAYVATIQRLGWKLVWMSVGWVMLGAGAFLIWARVEKTWPFGEKEIREEFKDALSS